LIRKLLCVPKVRTRCNRIVLILAGIEIVFFPVAAVFWIYYEKNVDNILMIFVVPKKSRTFSVSHVQPMSRCTRAERDYSQAASPSWSMEIFHTIDITLSL